MKEKRNKESEKGSVSRRSFVTRSTLTGGALILAGDDWATSHHAADFHAAPGAPFESATEMASVPSRLPDLRPARWLWYPSERCLQNTFVLFRRELNLTAAPRRAVGWVAADSRYLLEVNGGRVQWGPAPADPRWLEADPVDLTTTLRRGANVIGAQVLHYGQGDGTSPLGKPGFLFWLEAETEDGTKQRIVSDAAWRAHLARSWRPGQYKRWYLRALQEDFDARLYPYGWTTTEFKTNDDWLPALELNCPPNKPPLCSTYRDYQFDARGTREDFALRARGIPLLKESTQRVARLAEANSINWRRPPEEYFECLTPQAFSVGPKPDVTETGPGVWRLRLDKDRAAALTFEFAEQMVGWPRFTIEAPAGTVIELMVQEAHRVGGPAVLLNTHFHSWTRFTCREGKNEFETFDFESCRWVQLHVRNFTGEVIISDVGMRRRIFPWPHEPRVKCGEAPLQRLLDASINTLHNSAQETIVDGMGRERQQYSGDCGHQLQAIYFTFGERRLPARYLSTYSQGMTLDGYFLDCWPAYDRLARLTQRQIGITEWGPILDHGVGFNFDCLHHYLYTGDRAALTEVYPRLLRFAAYLKNLVRRDDGLLPVENLGVPVVWIDHHAYLKQRHKQCALNLYAAAMLEHALAPLCRAFGDWKRQQSARVFSRELLAATVRKFWDARRRMFVSNSPWASEERGVRFCDRSLATALLFNQNPGGAGEASLRTLVECPPEMGFSYPANAGWRLWALAEGGRADVILKDFRERWATMDSVVLNNTLQEDWTALPDSGAQWSHCPVAPLYVLYMSIAGIRPLAPGFTRYEIRPQLADLAELEVTANTAQGPLQFSSRGKLGEREVTIITPPVGVGEVVLRREEQVTLNISTSDAPPHHVRYQLPAATKTTLRLKYA